MTKRTYEWKPPQFWPEDRVYFEFREGCWLYGEVGMTETHYNDGVARHAYHVRADGHRAWRWVTEDKMRLAPSAARAA